MDLAYLHLVVNHFPIIGTLIGLVLMGVALFRKNILMQRSVLVMWIFLAMLSPLAMKTGEEAEEKIENRTDVSGYLIHEHEEAAETANVLMICLGLISLAALFFRNNTIYSGRLTMLSFILSVVVFIAMAKTGNEGGKIRHTEFSDTGKSVSGETHQEGENGADAD